MPNLLTHTYFAKDVLAKSSPKLKKTLKGQEHIYELFSFSFDPFFVYEKFPLREEIGDYLHTNHIDDFFLNFTRAIKERDLQKNPTVLAALYGHLTHYILDSKCHPYIIYKTGQYVKGDKSTRKYAGLHSKMELEIDAYMYENREKKDFSSYKMYTLVSRHKINKTLVEVLDSTYEETFGIEEGGKKYQHALNILYLGMKYVTKDKRGLKKAFYKRIDRITPRKSIKIEYFSYHVDTIDMTIFNNDHKEWCYPTDNTVRKTASFFDLYDESLEQCVKLFEATDKYLNNEITEEKYKTILGDKSYLSGLSWRDNRDFQYFEF